MKDIKVLDKIDKLFFNYLRGYILFILRYKVDYYYIKDETKILKGRLKFFRI